MHFFTIPTGVTVSNNDPEEICMSKKEYSLLCIGTLLLLIAAIFIIILSCFVKNDADSVAFLIGGVIILGMALGANDIRLQEKTANGSNIKPGVLIKAMFRGRSK